MDIVERLRDHAYLTDYQAASESADEIERLRAEVEQLNEHNKKVQALVDAGLDLCDRKDARIAKLKATLKVARHAISYMPDCNVAHEAMIAIDHAMKEKQK